MFYIRRSLLKSQPSYGGGNGSDSWRETQFVRRNGWDRRELVPGDNRAVTYWIIMPSKVTLCDAKLTKGKTTTL